MRPSIPSIVKQISYLLLGGAIISSASATPIEFNAHILRAHGIEDVDLSAFSGDSEQFAGKYLADIYLNEQGLYYNYPIYLYNKEGISYICFTKEILKALPVSEKLRSGAQKNVVNTTEIGECYGFEQYDPNILVEYDDDQQRLDLRVPHAYIVDFDRYWIPPDERDNGISGLVLDYNLLKMFSRSKWGSDNEYHTNNTFSSYGAIGLNLGRFRIRSNYQYNPKAEKKFDRTQTYGFTDIGSLNAQIYAGELYTRTNLFDSVRFKGVSLFTNESMMPSYLQGYAPQITGTANSNAIVTLRQYGNIIKQVQVPPGPFVISSLPSTLRGTVDVTVEESDGSTQEFQVEITSVPFLTRPGAFRYNVNIGELDPQYTTRNKVNTKFISTDGSYGLNNIISLNGGVNYTTNSEYQAYSLGLGMNLGVLGGFSFDITRSLNKADPDKRLTGHSYRFNYAKRFSQYTSLNIVGYRFSSREYTTLSNYVSIKGDNYSQLHLEKNRFSLSISQYIPSLKLRVSATGSKSTYWNQASNSYYNIAFNKVIHKGWFANTTVTLNIGHNRSADYKNNTVGIYFTIPLANRSNNISYSATYNDSYKNVSQQATFYDQGLGGSYSVGVSMNHKRDFSGSIDYALNATYNTNLSFGNLNSTASYTDSHQFMSASFGGSLTLTQHGLATHPYTYNDGSRLIINTEVSGVHINNNSAASNVFGLIGVSNVPDYYRNIYKIDNDNLPDNVEIPDNVFEVVPTQGAIAYRDAHAITGHKALVTIILPDGSHPPFGATIYRENGKDTEVGMVADKGLTYLTGLNKKSTFIVEWGQDHTCKLQIDASDLVEFDNVLCN